LHLFLHHAILFEGGFMQDFEERAKILLQAMLDMMDQQEETPYVREVFELTAVWDDTECDGGCWQEEARELLEDYRLSQKK
jgi:hypothetical protein